MKLSHGSNYRDEINSFQIQLSRTQAGPGRAVKDSGRATVLLDCHIVSNRFSTFGEPLEFLLVDRENP